MNEEWEYQKQIDRACSAQSSEMLPPPREDDNKVEEALDRIQEQTGVRHSSPQK